MRYLGGKQRIAKDLCMFLQEQLDSSGFSYFWEPFVGGNNIAHRIKAPHRICSDVNQALIIMWQAFNSGWVPDITSITPEVYAHYKDIQDPTDPMTAFIGFGCSFAGKWFGGFARSNKERNYAANALNSCLGKLDPGIKFIHGGYQEFDPISPTIIYCDPPYTNTTKYAGTASFDHEKFWDWCRRMSSELHRVFISEYTAPQDFIEVWSKETKTDLHGCGRSGRIERLFTFSR